MLRIAERLALDSSVHYPPPGDDFPTLVRPHIVRRCFANGGEASSWLLQSSTVIRAIGFRLSVYLSRQKKQKSQQTLTVNTAERLA